MRSKSYNVGKNNPNYKDGRCMIVYHCKFCNRLLANQAYQRKGICIICRNKPENNPHYKDGRTLKKYYCIDCKKRVSYYTVKRCRKCYGKWLSNHIMGKKNHRWLGGISFIRYPQEYTYYLRKKIKQRDNYKCQNHECNINEITFKQNHKKGLEVHHIDYNKQNCKEDNLITLCGDCNRKANFHRDYWYAYFMYKIEEKYGNIK